ncbi:MFS transporter [Amycolatopsis sp. NPDC059657]|uniref:MFS transporter n=1 Tax=Amycolatopsis sp. NPDC059657 TaxID=3346899 RepID=UPI00366EA05B
MTRYRDALAISEFRAVFAAHVLSMLGTIVAQFATSVLVFQRTGSPLLTTLVFALAFTPHLFAGTLFSALVDRMPVRRLLVSCNLATAALAATMSIPDMPVWALLALVFGVGLVGPVFSGARAATLPEILPGTAYIPGRSLFRLVSQGSQVAGLALGGLLLAAVSASTALLLEAAAFVFSAALLRFATKERPPRAKAGSLLRDSLGGLRSVLAVPALRRVLLLGWVVPSLALFPEALANPYAHEHGFSTVQLGLMMAVLPLGNILAEFIGIWGLNARRQVRWIAALAAVVFLPLLAYAFRPGFVVTLAILFCSGLGFAHHLGLDRLLLDVAPEHLRSRALALQTAGLMFWQGLGFAVAGALAQFIPIAALVPATAAAGLAAVALLKPDYAAAR